MNDTRVGFAMCGSFCSFPAVMPVLDDLASNGFHIVPIMSENAYATDTRFGQAKDYIQRVESACKTRVLHTIEEAEPIGPQKLLDILAVIPCTGNTLAKLAHGITDTSVTMACKAHLRNERPLVIAVSSNDALAANWQNIGKLSARKYIYFVPFGQDDHRKKRCSLVSDFSLLIPTLKAALDGKQLQPILLGSR